jgi:FlaA1/EpsC-like NDP-sugar epimerase
MRLYSKLFKWYFGRNALPFWSIIIADLLICFLSGLVVFALFFHASVLLGNIVLVARTLLLYCIIDLIFFRVFRTYVGIVRYSSFTDLIRIAYAMGSAFLVVWIIHYPILLIDQTWFAPIRTRYIVAIYAISILLMWMMRILLKSIYDVVFTRRSASNALIYGIADGGVAIAGSILNEKPRRFILKGFISHVPHFVSKKILGSEVYAEDDHLQDVIISQNIDAVIVSPLRNMQFRHDQKLQDILISNGVHIYMMNDSKEWGEDDNKMNEVTIEDLLPRDEIKVDMQSIGELIKGKRILITGSAGSIGSEMVRQIAPFLPAEMMLIDQAETPQHDIRLMMRNMFPNIKAHTVVASIQDKERMEMIFSSFRPDYVFHAAAYKHVPMMEDNPTESVDNNIIGTRTIADLSVKYGVKKFVMISTDKAVNPTNVMGCSKRICEIYVQSLDRAIKEGKIKGQTQFVTTRFGNVLGSNGSVIPLFRQQISKGGPVTVTHPDIIRFFMLIPEACKLVLEAGTKGHGSEIFIFDMGQPVRIADLARRMIMLSGAKDVKIVYTGLRAGEKLYEETLSDDEHTKPTFNDKIRIATVREYDYDEVCHSIDHLEDTARTFDDMETVKIMKEIVPEYKSQNSVYEKLDSKE